ncbi:MAG: BolA/IbaG family iron-sulfur metabolism protein [Proteobacteria bacterium]|nr:BolA/IbaG family iron-sulfur metabolism protein [Pseudomonadota bacterium]
MSLQQQIETKLKTALSPNYLLVENESHKHNVPKGSESHFKVTVVSTEFQDKKLIERHRLINAILKEELSKKIHALTLHTYTTDEWQKRNETARTSPPCRGGSLHESSKDSK